jgi:hypothetical protein
VESLAEGSGCPFGLLLPYKRPFFANCELLLLTAERLAACGPVSSTLAPQPPSLYPQEQQASKPHSDLQMYQIVEEVNRALSFVIVWGKQRDPTDLC